MLRIEPASAVLADLVIGDHRPHDIVGELLDLGHFVRRAEAVEEVEEWNACLEGGGVSDECEVHDFLNIVRGKERPARLSGGHDVLMIAENRERMRRNRTGRNVEYGGCRFARDFVHVRDHEQEPLRSGEGGGERTGRERTVNCASSTRFRLHFHYVRQGTPNIFLPIEENSSASSPMGEEGVMG